jgi:hypothetical protein
MTDSSTEPQDAGVLVISFEPDDEEWGTRDDRWREDLFDLRTDLEREVPEAVEPEPPKSDAMGVEIVPVIVALAHAGVFTSMVAGLKAWLANRPKRRSITATWKIGDQTGTLTITADNIDGGALVALGQSIVG